MIFRILLLFLLILHLLIPHLHLPHYLPTTQAILQHASSCLVLPHACLPPPPYSTLSSIPTTHAILQHAPSCRVLPHAPPPPPPPMLHTLLPESVLFRLPLSFLSSLMSEDLLLKSVVSASQKENRAPADRRIANSTSDWLGELPLADLRRIAFSTSSDWSDDLTTGS